MAIVENKKYTPHTQTKCRYFLQCLNNYSLVKMEPKYAESVLAHFSHCCVAAERGSGTPYS